MGLTWLQTADLSMVRFNRNHGDGITLLRAGMGKIALLSVVFGLLIMAGCGKENPVVVLPADVAGNYDFTRFEFVPDASAITPANLLDTLITERTYLRLIAGGQFILNYQFIDGPESIISGDFTVSSTRITLQASPGSEARLTSLLLHSPLLLIRSIEDESLTSSTRKTVDLAAFSGRYSGVPPVRGTLEIRLVHQH